MFQPGAFFSCLYKTLFLKFVQYSIKYVQYSIKVNIKKQIKVYNKLQTINIKVIKLVEI